ncbi:MAG: DEAD/DEAH box helicase [Kiritimatiellia bacterium]
MPRQSPLTAAEFDARALAWLRAATNRPDATFRDGQLEAIRTAVGGRSQLVVQATGWGKSMVYFLATRFLRDQGRGPTLIFSPLLSLMRNQIAAAKRVGIRCETINSTNVQEWDAIQKAIDHDQIDLLLISPERLANVSFREKTFPKLLDNPGLIVIDEAHCLSDWGHDFRPDYRRIGRIVKPILGVPILATTATANQRVIQDINTILGKLTISRGPLARISLTLQNLRLPSPEARLAWLAKTLSQRIRGSGIIYTLTIRDARLVARWLRKNGISAYSYASDSLPPQDDFDPCLKRELEDLPDWDDNAPKETKITLYRQFLEDLLLHNRIRALVATSALGMGFDKPDLTFVIHYQRPKSVVDYYQQVGRAGRAIGQAWGVLLSGEEDDKIADFFIRNAFPREQVVQRVIDLLRRAGCGLKAKEIAGKLNLRQGQLDQILKFLSTEEFSPIFKEGAAYHAAATANNYQMPRERIARLNEIRQREKAVMDAYVDTRECLMGFLCRELESPLDAERCGHCSVCNPELALSAEVSPKQEQDAAAFLRRLYQPIEPRKQWGDAQSAAEVFQIPVKLRIPEELQMAEGRALAPYGLGEWGRLVRQGKYPPDGSPARFPDKLVEALATMLREWAPEPKPSYLVPIPSRRDPHLLSDFAQRLSKAIGLPCIEALSKTSETDPQKQMQNSERQQTNIIRAFSVAAPLPTGGCLLLDDMVDSKWTLTVAAALLRRAGADFVRPIALADSSNESN